MSSFKFTLFFRRKVAAMKYNSFQLSYQLNVSLVAVIYLSEDLVCYLMTLFTSIHFFSMVLSLFLGIRKLIHSVKGPVFTLKQ